ncbi:MAG: type II secretion system GspH family protein [Fimbriimonadaceae bacterium]|nr:type II secretion system GspH family protein [Fimbriimonadaceae bacterium]
MTRKRAFTLVELLTVIAIIALLAAIAFPVLARSKDNANRSSDIANMNSIRTALQLYRVDQGAYPPALLGYATLYATGPNAGNVMPASQVRGFLYPRRVDSSKTFQPAYARYGNADITTAVWPPADPRPLGSAPVLDLNGDGSVDSNDDVAGARQAFGPSDVVKRPNPNNAAENIENDPNPTINAYFYKISGYDVSEVPTGGGASRWELRYAKFWTTWGLTTGGADDDPRQLGYTDPPDGTVVTWDSYFRELDASGQATRANRDVVLFLGGGARTFDSRAISERSWRVVAR